MVKVKTVVFASFKGGVGKTTCAIHVSVALSRRGYQVRLVDADPNASALNWYRQSIAQGNDLGVEVVHYLTSAIPSSAVNVVLFDLRGRPENEDLLSLATADLFILPISPSRLDLEATKETVNSLQRVGVSNYRVLRTRCPNKHQSERVKQSLEFSRFPVFSSWIGELQAFRSSAERGTVCLNAPEPNRKQAWAQVEAVTSEVIEQWI